MIISTLRVGPSGPLFFFWVDLMGGRGHFQRCSEGERIKVSGAVSELPMSGPSGTAFEFRDKPTEPGRLPPMVQYQVVGGRYFEAMRIAMAGGRDFDSSDRRDTVHSVIVNEAAAAQFWPGQDPLGKELRQYNGDPKAQLPWSRVVGVVRSIRQNNMRDQPRPLPDHEVVIVAVPRITGRKIDDQILPRCHVGQLQLELLPRSQRTDRLHPGLGAIDLADMPDAGEAPQGPLPLGDFQR